MRPYRLLHRSELANTLTASRMDWLYVCGRAVNVCLIEMFNLMAPEWLERFGNFRGQAVYSVRQPLATKSFMALPSTLASMRARQLIQSPSMKGKHPYDGLKVLFYLCGPSQAKAESALSSRSRA